MLVLERTDDIVEQWRQIADSNNPAGLLYPSGRFAEADIIVACEGSGYCGTACTYSRTRSCC